MAYQKVTKKVQEQRKVNNGEAMNKKIIEKGRAINHAKCMPKKK